MSLPGNLFNTRTNGKLLPQLCAVRDGLPREVNRLFATGPIAPFERVMAGHTFIARDPIYLVAKVAYLCTKDKYMRHNPV